MCTQEGSLKLTDKRHSLKHKENWRNLLLLHIQSGDELAKPKFFVAYSWLCRHYCNLAEGGGLLSQFYLTFCRYFLGFAKSRPVAQQLAAHGPATQQPGGRWPSPDFPQFFCPAVNPRTCTDLRVGFGRAKWTNIQTNKQRINREWQRFSLSNMQGKKGTKRIEMIIKMVNEFKLTVVHFVRPNLIQICACAWISLWTKKLWKIRSGPPGLRAVGHGLPGCCGPAFSKTPTF